MNRSVSVAEAKDHFAGVLRDATEGPVEITRRGEPVAVVLSIAEYRRLSAGTTVWANIEAFREEIGLVHDGVEPEAWVPARDRSPGRDVPR